MDKPGFIISWKSGHRKPCALFYQKTATGWGSTPDRAQAFRFPSARAAVRAWESCHTNPNASDWIQVEDHAQPQLLLL